MDWMGSGINEMLTTGAEEVHMSRYCYAKQRVGNKELKLTHNGVNPNQHVKLYILYCFILCILYVCYYIVINLKKNHVCACAVDFRIRFCQGNLTMFEIPIHI